MEEMRSLEDLLDLQIVDSEIDRLLEQRSSLPELQAYRQAHAASEEIAALVVAAEEADREAARALDKASGELEILEEKGSVEERRLYAGGLGARETLALREEVDSIKRRVSEREEQVLQLMEQREEHEKQLATLRADLDAARATEADLESKITAAWKTIDADIAVKEEKKKAIVPLIRDDLLELYDEIRPHKEGVAVGRLAEGICGGCHLKLSAAEQNEALRNDPPRCIHCRRILVPQ